MVGSLEQTDTYASMAQLAEQLTCQSNSAKKLHMELDSKKKGNLTEMLCMSAFMSQNCGVCIPFGDNSKYDFIADVDGRLLKIQVKTSSQRKGEENAIKFSCRSTHINCKGVQNVRYKKEDIDYFATYYNGQCYLVPVTECSVKKTLRLVPPKNGQQKDVTYATEYALEKQLSKIKGEVAEH